MQARVRKSRSDRQKPGSYRDFMMLNIRPATPADLPALRRVHQQAFARPVEAELVALLHADGNAPVSLVATLDGHIIGHILFSAVTLEPPHSTFHAVGLAPVGVLPEHQRQGIGSTLIRAGLEACRAAEYGGVVVLGGPGYYRRFGFRRAKDFGLGNEYGVDEEFMALELREGALAGLTATVKYAPEFRAVDVTVPEGKSEAAKPKK